MSLEPWFILGPTAVGKTAVSIALARKLNAEIVSADSMQLYRGMNIGTAKPSLAERKGVPHHLFDRFDVGETCDVGQFRHLALSAMDEIQNRGRRPLVVGGSGMYVRALTQGLFEGPGRDDALREMLETLDDAALRSKLEKKDPEAAAQIGRADRRRMIRAIEYFELTGKPISESRTQWSKSVAEGVQERKDLFVLTRDRQELYTRCEARVDAMFSHGFLDEVRELIGKGLAQSRTAAKAIGYAEAIRHLQGELNLEETMALIKQKTRNFVKRQLSWFRAEPGVQWIEIPTSEQPEITAIRILDHQKNHR
jgi:tRNA dimethylallyltransferase